jgi:2-oxo-4-hydroxy-4-carboxy-5-ureidoimidazoline decarboxylase
VACTRVGIMTDDERASVAVLDRAAAGEAAGLLRPCCASARWVAELVAGRPYRSLDRLLAASDAAAAALGWADVEEALAAHPRIGERAAGVSREASWSRGEQAGAAGAAAAVQAGLAAGNAEYEARFGHVFLICAAGRSGAEMLAELRARLGNGEADEQQVVRRELGAIARLRLARTFR